MRQRKKSGLDLQSKSIMYKFTYAKERLRGINPPKFKSSLQEELFITNKNNILPIVINTV